MLHQLRWEPSVWSVIEFLIWDGMYCWDQPVNMLVKSGLQFPCPPHNAGIRLHTIQPKLMYQNTQQVVVCYVPTLYMGEITSTSKYTPMWLLHCLEYSTEFVVTCYPTKFTVTTNHNTYIHLHIHFLSHIYTQLLQVSPYGKDKALSIAIKIP